MERQNGDNSQSVSLVEALNLKYSDENCVVDNFAHIQLSSRVKQKTKGQAQLPHEKREVVTLDCCGISVAGELGEILRVCPSVSELDLTGNYVNDWSEAMMIVRQLKYLRFLNLCGNPLDDSTYSTDLGSNIVHSEGFSSLKKLVLNSTKVSLSTVQALLKSFPSLVELHLSFNGYFAVPDCEHPCPTITRLHFNANNIKHWEDVEKLGQIFPKLETLIIMENPLSNLQRNGIDASFLSLECLCLTKTMLSTWEHVEALRKFASLNGVKLLGIPLFAELKEDEARELLVARLPNIECLNGTAVTSTERNNAERHFIRKFQNCSQPPARYHELIAIHGKLDPLADVNMDPAEYADVLMHITGKRARIQSISLRQTTGKFRKDMAGKLHVPIKKILLYYKDNDSLQGSEKMVYKDRHLYRYGIKNGDEIFVDVLD